MEKKVTIAAVMTAPRYESVYARNYIEIALKQAGVPLTVSGGVFYGQCMQLMLQDLLNKGVEYALTIDFDSMFTADHIRRLVSIVVGNPHIDACAAVQPKRGCGDLLAAKKDEASVEWDGLPIQVDTAHFGLTVLDLARLKDLPKPWFFSRPDKNGEWANEKLDDDVWFWKQWHDHGRTVYIDPGSRLGHLEEMVSVFDEQMQLKHYYPSKWSEIRESTVDSSVAELAGGL